ncbi:MAG: WYL domain-containing protein [Bacteroidaceae bacterium]|nr:WYL domain-containing protein [Bacteroidaceae bacterium]
MKIPSLFKEYIWLIETLKRNGRMTLGEIRDLWREKEESGGEELSRTSFNRHRDAILDIFGVIIECDRKDSYRYYIENPEVLQEDCIQNWMYSTLSVGNMMDENVGLQNRILLESIPSGDDKLKTIIGAMRENRRIRIRYHRYQDDDSNTFTVEPYCVKLFKRRWYMLVKICPETEIMDTGITKGYLYIFALDRIESMEILATKFTMDKSFDATTYFDECFGIIVAGNKAAERIVIRAYGLQPHYLRDLPLHHTQNEIKSTSDYTDFEVKMRPTDDLVGHLLSLGGWIKVMEPAWLAEEVKKWHNVAMERYNE